MSGESVGEALGILAAPINPAGPASWEPSTVRDGGYQGSSDPGKPTSLYGPQTQPVGDWPDGYGEMLQAQVQEAARALGRDRGRRNESIAQRIRCIIRERDEALGRGDYQPSRVEVDAAEATIFEAFDDGTHGRVADGYYRPLALSVLVNAHRAKLTLARLVER